MTSAKQIPNEIALSRELLVLPDMLSPGEEVLLEARASSPWAGLLVLTTDRLLFIRWRILLSGFKKKEFPWSKVIGVKEAPNPRGSELHLKIEGKRRPLRLELYFDKKRAPAIAREIEYRINS